jgi:hypothetical protein
LYPAWTLYQSNQTRGVPALHVYRNRSTPHFPLEPENRYKELVDRWRSLKDFFARREKNSEGHFVGAFNNYLTLDEFEDLFRTHFRDYLLSRLDKGTSHRMLAGKNKRWLKNPFRGLEVFEFEHAPIFRGRTKAAGELLDLLIRSGNIRKPFVLVIVEKLHPHEQGAFPVVMGQLVTLGRGEEEVPNRRSSLYSDFSAAEAEGKSRAGAQGFIDLFVKNRLLMADTDASGNVVISVAHEALLRHWTRVREWLAVNREFLRMRDRLDANLQIWKGRGRQKADLLQSGLPLAEGEKLLSDFDASLGPEQSDYVRASVAERHRQRHRRNLVRNGVLAVFALLAVGAGLQWFRAENEAKLAKTDKSGRQCTRPGRWAD